MNRQLPQTQNKTFVYSYDGTNIVAQEVTNGTSLDYEYFFYDASGSPVGMNYLGNNYLFKKNLQGDIIEIWGTADGSSRSDFRKLVTYTYDAWGNITSMVDTTDNWYRVGTANPFRYRGYYYDNESGLYYVSSRYYDPEIGRWISPEPNVYEGEFDEGAGLIGYNVYAYCANNPVMYKDETGESITAILVGVAIGALIGSIAGWGYAKYFNIPKSKTWKYVLGGAVIGAVIGGCVGYAVGASAGSGAVLWSGKAQGMDKIAMTFAKKNGLKVLEKTMRGRLLNVLSKKLSWKVMGPLWKSASTRFLLKYAGKQTFVHVFISATAYESMNSVFKTVELQVVAELGMKIIWHFYK